ncbi:hypothetical protein ACF1DV_36705 [Streptomyces achromogenes]|uniref:hypothetical protein n=1 Tax=Streptomyces achromogenes TaxID=67255 RepID=UPI0037015776
MPGPTVDTREAFTRLTKEYPDENVEAARHAFLMSKLHLVRTHPDVELADRERMVTAMAERLELGYEAMRTPVPGGVGYGVYYNEVFKRAFATGTALGWDIICPSAPGGNVNDYLYVTAMNRAVLGVEAFVSYYAQTPPRFKVYDWARPATPWQLDIPLSSLGPYLRTVASHGEIFQVMGVTNTTVEVASGKWRNEVQLWNASTGNQDLVYQFDYAATLAKQTAADYNGSWGPIIETFQTAYSGTIPLGGLAISLVTRDINGNWGPWGLLPWYNSYIRTDNVGFYVQFLDPNYNFSVKS